MDADLHVKDKSIKVHTWNLLNMHICVYTYISLQDLIILKDFFYDTEVWSKVHCIYWTSKELLFIKDNGKKYAHNLRM